MQKNPKGKYSPKNLPGNISGKISPKLSQNLILKDISSKIPEKNTY
jgi:hypothetical protein